MADKAAPTPKEPKGSHYVWVRGSLCVGGRYYLAGMVVPSEYGKAHPDCVEKRAGKRPHDASLSQAGKP